MNMMERAELEELRLENKELKQTVESQKEVIKGVLVKNQELRKKKSDKLIVFDGY